MIPLAHDGLPTLSVGSHRSPVAGACLMEYVSVLAGSRFSDRPRTTFPALRVLAQRVNDFTSDAGRPRLALLAPDLVAAHGDRARRRAATTAVVLCATASGLAQEPDNGLLRRLHRHALDRHARGAGIAWRYPLTMAVQTLRGHLEDAAEPERDRALHDLLASAVEESRRILGGPGPDVPSSTRRQPVGQS